MENENYSRFCENVKFRVQTFHKLYGVDVVIYYVAVCSYFKVIMLENNIGIMSIKLQIAICRYSNISTFLCSMFFLINCITYL